MTGGRDVGTLRLATRGSPLALWQARTVAAMLEVHHPGVATELVVVRTEGDRDRTTPISRLGGRGVFCKEVQAAVLEGRADLAVHSAKDLTSETPEGLTLAAVPVRGDVRDALVGCRWEDLGPGTVVATGSIRRRALIAAHGAGVEFVELRGNMASRLARVVDDAGVDAVVVASAALDRLDRAGLIAERLDPEILLPQVAQGALAVECRVDDREARERLMAIDSPGPRSEVTAERAFLAVLGGGCDLPVGALARADREDHPLRMTAVLAAPDGSRVIRASGRGGDPVELGRGLARRILEEEGGSALLSDDGS